MSNILFILSNPFYLVIILNRSTNFLFIIYYNPLPPPPPPPPPHTHTHTHTHAALDGFSKTAHFVFRSDKNFVGQTNFHILSDRMSCKVLATFVNTGRRKTVFPVAFGLPGSDQTAFLAGTRALTSPTA